MNNFIDSANLANLAAQAASLQSRIEQELSAIGIPFIDCQFGLHLVVED